MSHSQYHKWFKCFQLGKTSIEKIQDWDDFQHQQMMKPPMLFILIHANYRLNVWDVAQDNGISIWLCYEVLTEQLGMHSECLCKTRTALQQHAKSLVPDGSQSLPTEAVAIHSYPTYSPDLALVNFSLFPEKKPVSKCRWDTAKFTETAARHSRKRIPGSIPTMAERMGVVCCKHGGVLWRG